MTPLDPLAPGLAPATARFLRALPKAELHLHLDGSLRPLTAVELARERRLDGLGELDLSAVRDRLVAPLPCRDQAQLLRAFELPVALLQDAESLERVTRELLEDLAADGVSYAEIRWAPGLHTARGLGLRQGIAAVVRAARGGPLPARLIVVAMRSHEPARNLEVARAAAVFAGEGVAGFDLAGPEAAFPDPLLHRRAFGLARSSGLGITVHAGEWGGSAQVRRALELEPARIAHGGPAADDPALMAELRARRITLDLCPTSNWQAGLTLRLADHPLPRLARAGVPVTLSTDDRTVSDVTLSAEYERAAAILGLSLAELVAIDRHALEAAFLSDDEPLRAQLIADLDQFAAQAPAQRS